MTTTHYDVDGQPLAVGDHVAFMVLKSEVGFAMNSMGTGTVVSFTPQMVNISTAGGNVRRLPKKIVKTFAQPALNW